MKKIKKHWTKGFVRHRLRNPKSFMQDSFRVIDPGRPGHTKMVIGKLRHGRDRGKWRVQSVLVDKKDYQGGSVRVVKRRGRPLIIKK